MEWLQGIAGTAWEVLVLMLWAFVFVGALVALWAVISDLMRDRELSGWFKALWIIALVFIPLLTALVYFIFRGKGMAERASNQAAAAQRATDDYIRSVSGGSAGEIAQAKELLDSGAITPAEFETLKAKALAG